MTKFYQTKNAGKPVVAAGRTFTFEASEFFQPSHSWWGIYATSDAAEIAALDSAVAARLIFEITEAEYQDSDLKKKRGANPSNIVSFSHSNVPSSSPSGGKPAIVVDEPVRPSTAETLDAVLTPAAPAKTPPRKPSRK